MLKRILRHVAISTATLLPGSIASALIRLMVAGQLKRLSPEDGLRFLFGLDHFLYGQTGQLAVAYGKGTHTKHEHTGYHDFFVQRLVKDESVLDVGCGSGELSRDMAERAGCTVTGIDINADSVEKARTRTPHARVQYIHSDATRELPGERYDVVVLSNVLEHIDERQAFLAALLRSARPARLLIRVPMFERDWRVPLKRELGCEWRLDTTHATEYTIDQFRIEMADAGLEIDHEQFAWGEIWCEARPATGNTKG